MKSSKIRTSFLDFFEKNDHKVLDSAPLLPSDPELLFNIAGMVPFKPYFLAEEDPPSSRITTSQKCLRTTDIENVGHTARHLTFFEMLGNFSFGDYFKREAIRLSWGFFTEKMDLDPERLWISVFGGDQAQGLEPDAEARDYWLGISGVPEERIINFGTEENFWAMDATGPCGPCSEILYDQESTNASPAAVKDMVKAGEDRILELWNLVFMQYNRDEKNNLSPLPQRNIDTGLGLERLCAVLQNKRDNFSTDLFQPIIEATVELSPASAPKQNSSALRIIADHVRAASFLLAEGLLPGNEGRGYVLRRLIRRASRWGRKLDFREPFLHELVPNVVEIMGNHYQELEEDESLIRKNLQREEEQFNRTLDRGLSELRSSVESVREQGADTFSGRKIFELYETHGFPVEMTEEILREEGLDYDESEIEAARQKHQQQSRSESDSEAGIELEPEELSESEFTGYEKFTESTEVIDLYQAEAPVDRLESGESGQVVLAKTPFYAERGGQVGDTGRIDGFRVQDTVEKADCILHCGEAETEITRGQQVTARVDKSRRRQIMRHHTATHLLQAALREQLGEQVMQSGSHVAPGYLRFDFTHNQQVEETTLEEIESRVNEWIYRQLPVEKTQKKRRQAQKEGALAFFGEHYGEVVRVVKIIAESAEAELVSQELCGGTHVDNTVQLGLFAITDETSVASGVRRIEARVGRAAYEFYDEKRERLRGIRRDVGVQRTSEIVPRYRELEEKVDTLEKQLESFRQKEAATRSKELAETAEEFGSVKLVLSEFEDADQDALKKLLDQLREELEQGVVLLMNRSPNSAQLLLGVTESLAGEFDAGDVIGNLGRLVGGGGGGSPEFAQAGGGNPDGLGDVKEEIKSILADRYGSAARD